MKYKLAVFDMDGTILNTLEDLADSTNYALRKHGLPERTLEEVRTFVGNGIGKLIERAIPQGSGELCTGRFLILLMTIIKITAVTKQELMRESLNC